MADHSSNEHHYVFTLADPGARSAGGFGPFAQQIALRIIVSGVVAWVLMLLMRTVSDSSPYLPLPVIQVGMAVAAAIFTLLLVARTRRRRRQVLDAGLPVVAVNLIAAGDLRTGMWVPNPYDLRRCAGPRFAPMLGQIHAHRVLSVAVGPHGYSVETTGGPGTAAHDARLEILDFDPVCGWDRNEDGHAGLRLYLAPGWGNEPVGDEAAAA